MRWWKNGACVSNLTSEEVKAATAKVAEKNQWQYEILDEVKLIKDLKKIEMSAEQPKATDDAIASETVRFFGATD